MSNKNFFLSKKEIAEEREQRWFKYIGKKLDQAGIENGYREIQRINDAINQCCYQIDFDEIDMDKLKTIDEIIEWIRE